MTNPSSGWDTVPIRGTFLNPITKAPKRGSIVFTFTERVAMADGSAVFPGGGSISVPLGAETGSISLNFPAADDPDITPNGFSVKVEEKFEDGGGKIYYIQPLLSQLPHGINLATVIVPPGSPGSPVPALVKGIPGGVAGLDTDGDVVDAGGRKVVSGGEVSSWNDLTDKPTTYPPTIGSDAASAVAGNDSRLTDARAPKTNSVTNANVAPDAAINADKLVEGSTNKLLTASERAKLAGLSNVDMIAALRSTDAVCRYTGTQPLRNTITSDPLRRVRWVSSTTPIIGNGYAIDGLDVWEKTS